MGVFFLLLSVILSEFMRIQEEKTELQKKVHRRICMKAITLLAAHPPSNVIFYRFFRLLPPFPLLQSYIEKNFPPEKGWGRGRGSPSYPHCLPVSTALHKHTKWFRKMKV